MISFSDFRRLWLDAQDISDHDQYVAETGGSIDCEDVDRAVRLLKLIHRFARAGADRLRAESGLTQAEFARRYGVPMSTVNKWDMRINRPLPWAHVMIAFSIVSDLID